MPRRNHPGPKRWVKRTRREHNTAGGCGSGKQRYRDKAEATAALHRITAGARDTARRLPVRVYECPECAGWHQTSRPARDVA